MELNLQSITRTSLLMLPLLAINHSSLSLHWRYIHSRQANTCPPSHWEPLWSLTLPAKQTLLNVPLLLLNACDIKQVWEHMQIHRAVRIKWVLDILNQNKPQTHRASMAYWEEEGKKKENNERTQVCISERNQDTWNKCSAFHWVISVKALFVISRRRERPPTDLIFRGLDHVISMLIATSST